MTEFWTASFGTHGLGALQLLQLFGHFLLLSLLAVGGAITTAPEMQRYLVDQQGWLTVEQFSASVGLAQAAPGPNVLFIAVLGWNTAGALGMLAAMVGILIPSCTLAWSASRWLASHRQARAVTVFTAGLAPLTIGLLGSTSWVLAEPVRTQPLAWLLVAVSVWVMLRTRWSPMWLIGLGALVGAAGGV
jgi:chromate transporter